MDSPQIEFNSITSIKPEALGEPGKRTFRVLVDDASGSALIWLEKEQLFQLAMAITRLQAILPSSGDSPAQTASEAAEGPVARLEFAVGKMVLGHEGNSDRFVIDAYDAGIEEGEEAGPTVRLWGVRGQLKSFAAEALKVCAAGRPICPLCAEPIDSTGHKCARVNGHDVRPLTQDD